MSDEQSLRPTLPSVRQVLALGYEWLPVDPAETSSAGTSAVSHVMTAGTQLQISQTSSGVRPPQDYRSVTASGSLANAKERARLRREWRRAAWSALTARGVSARNDYQKGTKDDNIVSLLNLTEHTFETNGTCDADKPRWVLKYECRFTLDDGTVFESTYPVKLAGHLSTDEYVLVPIG